MSPDSLPARVFAPLAGGRVRYMFIDFNAYFASVEQHDDPALVGRPVIVTPLKSEHSGAIAASYEAKALGISRGTSVVEARRICPDIAVRPARHDRYVGLHLELMAEIARHLPVTRVHSIDECLCRLSREEYAIPVAEAKARAVKRGIAERIGPAMRCSIGLAPSPMLAKLASDLEKPDGLVALPINVLPAALVGLPLRAIAGIGAGVERRLNAAGVQDFRGLWALAPRHARAIWGSVAGERFVYGLHGHDLPIIPEPGAKKMIGHSRVLGGGDRGPARARIVARALLLKAASRLRHCGLYARTMHVSVKLHPDGAIGHDVVLRATQNSWRLLTELDAFWQPMMRALDRRRGAASLRMVTIYLGDLSPRPPEADLFVAATHDARDACEAALWDGIDRLNRRFGKAKVMLASQHALDLDYLGVKIAFSRIPDPAEFAV